MTGFDYAVLGIVIISLSLGLWRGLVYEVLSVFGWPIAFILSRQFAPAVESWLPVGTASVRTALAYAVVFIAALILWSMLVWVLTTLIRAAGLGVLDSLLGGFFGLLRALIIILILVWIAGISSIPEQRFWQEASFSRSAEVVAEFCKFVLPDDIAARIQYKNRN